MKISKKLLKTMATHFLVFILASAFFIFSFHTPLFRNITIFFYRGIALLLLTALLTAVLLYYLKKSRYGDFICYYDIILSVVIIFSLNLIFFTHVPVTADRSLSVFLLGYLDEHPEEAYSAAEIKQAFLDRYIDKNRNIEKRFNEQLISGNIAEEGVGYRITDQGALLIKFYKMMAKLFIIDRNNIVP